jgi:lantibiotic modifying enzyme
MKALEVWDHGEYGWVERAGTNGTTRSARYTERSGVLLALAYALGATDLHRHTVIACGDHPVLVDHETIGAAAPGATVESTGLLPRARSNVGGIDSDAPLEPLLRGFCAAYRRIEAHPALLDGFAALSFRLIERDTAYYSRLVRRSCHPAFMADGLSRCFALEPLARHAPDRSVARLRAEAEALFDGDVPYFSAEGTATPLPAQAFCDEDLERQQALIVRAFSPPDGRNGLSRGTSKSS